LITVADELDPRQAHLVAGTLRVALEDAARRCAEPGLARGFEKAAGALFEAIPVPSRSGGGEQYLSTAVSTALTQGGEQDPREEGSRAGVATEVTFTVTREDTAAAMGHPDPAMTVVGSPRLALWFEIVSSHLLEPPGQERTHVGVGILVHHLGRAVVGEQVTVRAVLEELDGRRAVFSLQALASGRLIATGVHERIVLGPRPLTHS